MLCLLFSFHLSYSTSESNGNENEIECGSIIKQDIKLTSDLICSSDGLSVSKQDGITIDLNGYSIKGPGITSNKAGLEIGESKNITITGNGTVKNFQAVILTTTSENIGISSTNFQKNEIGIILINTKDSTIEDSIYNSNNIGMSILSGDKNMVNNNIFYSKENAFTLVKI